MRPERSGRFRCIREIRVPTLNLDASRVESEWPLTHAPWPPAGDQIYLGEEP
jgi:hypothetical protein